MTESAKYEYPGIVKRRISVGKNSRPSAPSLTFGCQHLNNKNDLAMCHYVGNNGV